jgi:hypothetical protein
MNSTMQTSMLTGADGSYKFMNLVNGTYNVTEETRSGFTNISPTTVQVTINGSDIMNITFTNQPPLIDDWLMFRHDTFHTGVISDIVMPLLNLLWNYTTGGYFVYSSPAVSNGGVYVGSYDGNIYAFSSFGSISGQKFEDLNGNGTKDTGEPGLQGWTITLTKPDGQLYLDHLAMRATS